MNLHEYLKKYRPLDEEGQKTQYAAWKESGGKPENAPSWLQARVNYAQTPKERAAKYKVARSLGAGSKEATQMRDWHSPKLYRRFNQPVPSYDRRKEMGIVNSIEAFLAKAEEQGFFERNIGKEEMKKIIELAKKNRKQPDNRPKLLDSDAVSHVEINKQLGPQPKVQPGAGLMKLPHPYVSQSGKVASRKTWVKPTVKN